jgi:hypothetical protein
MIASPDALEQRILQGYLAQLPHYDRAAAILGRQGHGEGDPVNHAWAHDLATVLNDVTALDAAMRDDKEAWRRSGEQPGPELAAVLDRLAARIGELAVRIDRHVADLEARKLRLLPEIDTFIQKRRMLQAYGKYGDRQTHVAKSS